MITKDLKSLVNSEVLRMEDIKKQLEQLHNNLKYAIEDNDPTRINEILILMSQVNTRNLWSHGYVNGIQIASQ